MDHGLPCPRARDFEITSERAANARPYAVDQGPDLGCRGQAAKSAPADELIK